MNLRAYDVVTLCTNANFKKSKRRVLHSGDL